MAVQDEETGTRSSRSQQREPKGTGPLCRDPVMSVDRYDCPIPWADVCAMEPCDDGDHVTFEDYEKLLKKWLTRQLLLDVPGDTKV